MFDSLMTPVWAALALFSYAVVADPQTLHVEPISTPESLIADGYAPAVASARLMDAARRIEEEARSFKPARRLAADAEQTALRVLAQSVGATPAIRAMQKTTGRIGVVATGEIVRKSNQLELTLRTIAANGAERRMVVVEPSGAVDPLLHQGALALLETADPYVRAAWQFKIDHSAAGCAAALDLVAAAEHNADAAADPRWLANLAGVVAFTDNRIDAALAHFQRALALDPEFSPALVNFGAALASIGLHRDAIESYRRALAAVDDDEWGPANAAAYTLWGVSLAALHQAEAARQSFEYAVQVAPEYPDVYFKWSQVMRAMGNEGEAAEALQRRPDSASRPPLYPEYLVGAIGPDAFSLVRHGQATPN